MRGNDLINHLLEHLVWIADELARIDHQRDATAGAPWPAELKEAELSRLLMLARAHQQRYHELMELIEQTYLFGDASPVESVRRMLLEWRQSRDQFHAEG
jgi:hypothetical protein